MMPLRASYMCVAWAAERKRALRPGGAWGALSKCRWVLHRPWYMCSVEMCACSAAGEVTTPGSRCCLAGRQHGSQFVPTRPGIPPGGPWPQAGPILPGRGLAAAALTGFQLTPTRPTCPAAPPTPPPAPPPPHSSRRLALSYLDEDLLLQLDGFFLDRAQAVRAPALLNMAAVQLKQEDYHAAVITCNQVGS